MNIQEYLTQLLILSGCEDDSFSLEEEKQENRFYINILLTEEQAGFFIGSKGETLDAIQQLVRVTFNKEFTQEEKLILDINGYKKQRQQALIEKAEQVAQDVAETGRHYYFRNLNSYERYTIHSYLANSQWQDKIETHSEDSDTGRILVVDVKNA